MWRAKAYFSGATARSPGLSRRVIQPHHPMCQGCSLVLYVSVQVRHATAVLEPLCGRLCVMNKGETAAEIEKLRLLRSWLASLAPAATLSDRAALPRAQGCNPTCAKAATLRVPRLQPYLLRLQPYVTRCAAVLRLTGEAGDAPGMQPGMKMQPEMQPVDPRANGSPPYLTASPVPSMNENNHPVIATAMEWMSRTPPEISPQPSPIASRNEGVSSKHLPPISLTNNSSLTDDDAKSISSAAGGARIDSLIDVDSPQLMRARQARKGSRTRETFLQGSKSSSNYEKVRE